MIIWQFAHPTSHHTNNNVARCALNCTLSLDSSGSSRKVADRVSGNNPGSMLHSKDNNGAMCFLELCADQNQSSLVEAGSGYHRFLIIGSEELVDNSLSVIVVLVFILRLRVIRVSKTGLLSWAPRQIGRARNKRNRSKRDCKT